MSTTRYSDGELEQQYNNQRRVPEFPGMAAGWEQRTAELRRSIGARCDLAYGSGARERLDLYPGATADAPLLVFIHGGYWQRGDKSVFGFVASGALSSGFQVAVINYGLCPQQALHQAPPQVARAITWLLTARREHGIRAAALYLGGHSAGGHLAARMMSTDFSSLDPALPPCPMAGVLAISGVFELEPLIPTSINQALGLDVPAARRESPALHRPVTGACPLTAAVGGDESEEFLRQSRHLADTWADAARTRYLEVPGTNHFSVLETLARPDGALCKALMEMAAGASS